jgi:hypothetical protein
MRRIELTLVGVLVIYLVSTYSVELALACAGVWWVVLALVAHNDDRRRGRLVDALNDDPDLDVL